MRKKPQPSAEGHASLPGRHTQTGSTLFLAGALLLLVNLALAAFGLLQFLAAHAADAIGIPAAAALALLRFLQTLAFQPADLLPLLYGILILFIAFAGMLAGLLLLRNRNRTMENA